MAKVELGSGSENKAAGGGYRGSPIPIPGEASQAQATARQHIVPHVLFYTVQCNALRSSFVRYGNFAF